MPVNPAPTAHSLHLRQLAGQIAAACPIPLGDEIALVGGAARGTANADSDLDLDFWVAEMPPLEARLAFLGGVGAHDLVIETEPRADGSEWIVGNLTMEHDDAASPVPIEAGWQMHAALEAEIAGLCSGELLDRGRMALAELLLSAFPLRQQPEHNSPLARVQAQLRHGLPAASADSLRAHAAVLLTTALPGSDELEQAHTLLWFADQRRWPPMKLRTMRWIRAAAGA